jgi:hypothetical protein
MKEPIQAGPGGRVPASPEKRLLISLFPFLKDTPI